MLGGVARRFALVLAAVLAAAAPHIAQDQGARSDKSDKGAWQEIDDKARASIDKGIKWLVEQQNFDGSWG